MPEDSLNQLLNNYQNMSMEDLGKSLLSRQATNRRSARRSMKRDEKIQKVLAVLLAGQAVFDKAAQHRVKEVDEYFDIVKNQDKNMIAKMNIVGRVGQALPLNLIKAENPYALYTADTTEGREIRSRFQATLFPIMYAQMQKIDPVGVKASEAMRTIDSDIGDLIDAFVAPYYLKPIEKGKYAGQTRMAMALDSGSEFFADVTEGQVFAKMYGFDEGDQAVKRGRNKLKRKREIEGSAGWTSSFKILGQLFKGEPTIFSKLQYDPETGIAAEGTGLRSELAEFLGSGVEISELITPNYADIVKHWRSNKDYMTLARGDPELISTADGGRPQIAVNNVIIDLKKQYSTLSYDSQDKIIPSQKALQLRLLDDLEEAQAYMENMFGDDIRPNDLDKASRFANAFGALRMAMDNPELAGRMGEAYKVNVSKLSSLNKDTLAMKIILLDGMEPVDPVNYKDLPRFNRDVASGRTGTIEMYGPGDREWETFLDWGRDSNIKDDSNWINTLDNIQAYLRPGPIKEIDSNGNIRLQEEIDRMLDNLTNPKNRAIVADIFTTQLQNYKDKGFGELGEQVMGGLYGDPRIEGLMSTVYPTLVDAQDAYRDDTFSLIPAPPPGDISVPTPISLGERDHGYGTFSISPEIQAMLDTFSPAERTIVGSGLMHSTSQADSDRYAARIEAQYQRNQEKEPIPPPPFDPDI